MCHHAAGQSASALLLQLQLLATCVYAVTAQRATMRWNCKSRLINKELADVCPPCLVRSSLSSYPLKAGCTSATENTKSQSSTIRNHVGLANYYYCNRR